MPFSCVQLVVGPPALQTPAELAPLPLFPRAAPAVVSRPAIWLTASSSASRSTETPADRRTPPRRSATLFSCVQFDRPRPARVADTRRAGAAFRRSRGGALAASRPAIWFTAAASASFSGRGPVPDGNRLLDDRGRVHLCAVRRRPVRIADIRGGDGPGVASFAAIVPTGDLVRLLDLRHIPRQGVAAACLRRLVDVRPVALDAGRLDLRGVADHGTTVAVVGRSRAIAVVVPRVDLVRLLDLRHVFGDRPIAAQATRPRT